MIVLLLSPCVKRNNRVSVDTAFQDKNNNNTVDKSAISKITSNSGSDGKSTKNTKKAESPKTKSVKVSTTKNKRDDDDIELLNNNAKRMKIASVSVTASQEAIIIVDSPKPLEKNAPNTQQNRSSLSVASSSSSLSSSPPSTSTKVSNDDVIVVLDSSIGSDCSNDDSFANTTVTSKRNRSSRGKNFNFDVLQTDDETDTEDNTPYAPEWSKYHKRITIVIGQERVDTKVIDELFGCRPQHVDIKAIFPNSKPIARRRSTAEWDTPPRYSSLPKY